MGSWLTSRIYQASMTSSHLFIIYRKKSTDKVDLFVVLEESYIILNSVIVGFHLMAKREEQAQNRAVDSKAWIWRSCIQRDREFSVVRMLALIMKVTVKLSGKNSCFRLFRLCIQRKTLTFPYLLRGVLFLFQTF